MQIQTAALAGLEIQITSALAKIIFIVNKNHSSIQPIVKHCINKQTFDILTQFMVKKSYWLKDKHKRM